ncbi:MAG: hypothetical protein ACOXZK_05895 [Bacteroidales bacterium]|jgi:hypothetical protein|nr:hypothetical protein [Bacteroidales bacterium]
MKKNKTWLFIIALLVVLIVILWGVGRKKGVFEKSYSDFAISDTASVTKIFLADKIGNSVLLSKDEAGIWMVNNKYVANKDNIGLLLHTMEYLSVWSPVPDAAHDNIIKRMAVVSTKVEIYQENYLIDFWKIKLFKKERLTKTYYMGEPTMTNESNVALMEGASQAFIVYLPGFRGFVSPRYSAYEIDWRDHTVFKIRLPQIKTIVHENFEEPAESFIIEKVGSRTFQLKDLINERIIPAYDTAKVFDHVGGFRKVNYESVERSMSREDLDSLIQNNLFYRLSVEDMEGNVRSVKMFRLPELLITNYQTSDELIEEQYNLDRLLIEIEGEPEIFKAQYFVFDRLIQPLSYYLITNQEK